MSINRFRRNVSALIAVCAFSLPASVLATNGMNMEGYGPVSLGMGGTGMAFDNGTAALMNNPATLALMPQQQRLDIALGMLGPNVGATHVTSGGQSTSSGDAYYMPAVGWVKRKENLIYGFGMFAQGGMGTEYDSNSIFSNPGMMSPSPNLVNRSELSVGRFLLPLVIDYSPKLKLGFSFDVVWAGLDLQMAMSEAQFANLANPMAQTIGTASGSLVTAFGSMYEPFGGSGINTLHHAYFDFNNDSDFSGKARSYGYAGKIGAVYEVSRDVSIGASYHSQTSLDDMEATGIFMSMAVNGDSGVLTTGTASGTDVDATIPLSGKIKVVDFQWPAMLALGASVKATDKLTWAADYKRINWSDAMENFSMVFTADNVASNGGFAGLEMNATLFQKWQDQDVIALGAAYQTSNELTLRIGANLSDNPVPNQYLNALFPAIVEDHYTAGFGYSVRNEDSVDFALSYAPKVESTTTNGIDEIKSSHGQLSWQLMYSRYWQ